MIYGFMQKYVNQFEICKMAKIFKVSRAGYYKHVGQLESKQSQANRTLLEKIKVIYTEKREVYGSPRIYRELKRVGEACSRKRVAKLMRVNQIRAKSIRRWRPAGKTGRDATLIAPNLVAQNFNVQEPDQIWVLDITYIHTSEGWLYLSTVMDLFSRKIVGFSMGDCVDTALVKSSLQQAIYLRQPKIGLILHSDRVSQYTSRDYHHLAMLHGFKISMSAQGYCYDNAVMESFYHTLKMEHVYLRKYRSRPEAMLSIFEYIEVFYNRQRSHSFLNYLSPEEFERQNQHLFQIINPQSRVKLALPAIEA